MLLISVDLEESDYSGLLYKVKTLMLNKRMFILAELI